MKSLALVLLVVSLQTSALAAGSTCSDEEMNLLREAKSVLVQEHQVLNAPGTNAIGIGLCRAGDLESALRASADAYDIENGNALCGISLSFIDEAGLESFSVWLSETFGPGSTMEFTTGNFRLNRVPVCGRVGGVIVPHPGGTVRN